MWTSDITHPSTGEGWLYLCAIRDGCSHRVIGYAFAETLNTDLVETALRRAVTFRDPGAAIAAGAPAGVGRTARPGRWFGDRLIQEGPG